MLRTLVSTLCFLGAMIFAVNSHAQDQVWSMGPDNELFECDCALSYDAWQSGTTWYYHWDLFIQGGLNSDCLQQKVEVLADRSTVKINYQWESATESLYLGETVQESSTPSMFDIEAALRTKLSIPWWHTLVFEESNVEVLLGHNDEPCLFVYVPVEEDAAHQPKFDIDIGTSGDTTVQTGDNEDSISFNDSQIENIVVAGNGGDDVINCGYTNYGCTTYIFPGYGTNYVIGTADENDTIYHPLGSSYESTYSSSTLGVEIAPFPILVLRFFHKGFVL